VRERPAVLPSRAALTPAGVSRTHLPPPRRRRLPAWAGPTLGASALAVTALGILWLGFAAVRVDALGERTAEADDTWTEEGLRAVRGVRNLTALGVEAPDGLDGWVADLTGDDVAARRAAAAAVEAALADGISRVQVVPVAERERMERVRELLQDVHEAGSAARALHEERHAARMSLGGRMVRALGVVD
jgi:hypothetical protein